MNGPAPLLRTAATVVCHSPSKIPHLRFHIALRQTRLRQQGHNRANVPTQQRRFQSTLVASDFVERSIETSESHERSATASDEGILTKEDLRNGTLSTVSGFTNVVKATNMFDFLEEGLLDQILSGLMSDSVGTPFILQADDQLFKKALLALDPDYFIEPFKEISRHTKGQPHANKLQSRSIDGRLSTFAAYLDRIVALRRESGRKLDLEMCNHLLRCAGSMGDKQLANSVFHKIVPEDGIKANLETYNYYCQAMTWSNAFGKDESYNLRVTPRHLEIRASRRPPPSLSGHTTSTTLKGVKGIREQVLDIFKQCLGEGNSADEFLFSNLMLAMGREADIDGVKSILKSVWNIDIDMLGAYDEEEVQSPTFYESDHPLRPSERLLYAIAHIFGSNNDIRTAWLLVDFISRNYNIQVTERVWQHLCEWGFVLSLNRTQAEQRQGRATGQVPRETLVQMVEAMIDEPHNIVPNSLIQYLLSRSWRESRHLDKTVHHVAELEKCVTQQHAAIKEVVNEVMAFAGKASHSTQLDAFANVEFYKLRRRFMVEYYKFQRDLQLMNIAVNSLLMEKNWAGSRKLTDWERRRLPELVETFATYLPPNLMYNTKTGIVQLRTQYKRRARIYDRHHMDYRSLPRVHNAMDTDDQAKLRLRMKALPEVIVGAKKYCFNCESIGHTHDKCKNKAFASSTLDYSGEKHREVKRLDDEDIFVLDPAILRVAVPYAFEVDGDKEHANPSLPFQ